ncbi:MAG: hypothetical protein JJE19_06975 [Methanosarcinales archaeon]|nr:hypothetical protein [Methanosarcinales archaeon]
MKTHCNTPGCCEKERWELTKKQKSAVRDLEKAFKRCKKAKVLFHNCYGNLIAYDGEFVELVDDHKDEFSCTVGTIVDNTYDLDSWADDLHFIHFIKTVMVDD